MQEFSCQENLPGIGIGTNNKFTLEEENLVGIGNKIKIGIDSCKLVAVKKQGDEGVKNIPKNTLLKY